jgi:uncharacterized protein (TIGR01244 family)
MNLRKAGEPNGSSADPSSSQEPDMTAYAKINDTLSIAGQLALEDFPGVASIGFKTVINNRSCAEEPGQPSSAQEAAAAAAAGLGYAHIPVHAASISEQDVRDMQKALSEAEHPVLAHCRSGTRSLMLYVIGEVLDGRMDRNAVIPFGADIGIDLRGADAWLAVHGH